MEDRKLLEMARDALEGSLAHTCTILEYEATLNLLTARLAQEESPASDWRASIEQAYQEARLVYADYCDHTREALGYMRSVLIAKCVDGLPSRSQADET